MKRGNLMKNISIHVKSIDSIDSNILSAKIYTNDNQLILKRKILNLAFFNMLFHHKVYINYK